MAPTPVDSLLVRPFVSKVSPDGGGDLRPSETFPVESGDTELKE